MKSPISFKRVILLAGICAAMALGAAFTPDKFSPVPSFKEAAAATPNVAVGAGQVVVVPFHISGQYTTTTASVLKFNMPFPCRILGVGASARASGGTSPTLTVDLKNGGVSVLSAPITVTAATYTEGTVATPTLADEAVMTADLTIGGTTPTWNDIVILITVVRR